MKRVSVIAFGLLFAGLAVSAFAQTSGAGAPVALIDGAKGLENWNQTGEANWRVEDGAIVADKGKGGYLISKKSYKDFHISAEFWADHTTNSGIFIRISDPDPSKVGAKNSYEVNIFDQRPEPAYGTGAIVFFATVSPMPKAGGKWNTFEITAKGEQLTVLFNGVQTVNLRNGMFVEGPFALQYGGGANNTPGGAIKWRKVQIREL
jgi:Domain of Unknown Function (DUF1080)